MDAFSYLSVLLSIILGLAITQVLQGFRGLMLARSRVRTYWPSLAWAILLLVLDVQAWWAMYDLRFRHEWSFLGFAVVLAQTVPLYLLAGLVLPDIGIEGSVVRRGGAIQQVGSMRRVPCRAEQLPTQLVDQCQAYYDRLSPHRLAVS
ncbi:MAG TPA: hypothetical protein VFE77_10120 [Rhodanobacter sp.]|nr:hypothetical protein [Rhodanobacter sp.]